MSGILQGRSVLSTALLILIVFTTNWQWAVKAEKNKIKQGHKDFWKKRSFELSEKNGSMLLNVGAGCGNVSDTHTKKHKSGGKKCVNLPYRVFSFRGLSKVKSMILCQHLERSIFRFW